jgi:hypothetical protein
MPMGALLGRVTLAAVLVPLAARGDPEHRRGATATYNLMVGAIHATVRDYRRCVIASLGRDDCGAELIELQVTHRDFEAAVSARQAHCGNQ